MASVPIRAVSHWVVGGGEMGERIRALDWRRTALGPLEKWSQPLRTAVGMLLASRAQVILFWGPEFAVLYNDAYRPVFGGKHPSALGLPGHEAWSEIWEDQLGPLLRGVVDTGQAYWATDLLFCIQRHGYLEETYFDISYDPIRDESGNVAGVYCIVTETTGRVCSERRLRTLSGLGRIGLGTQSAKAVLERAATVLGDNPDDIAFALLYERDAAGGQPQLRSQVGFARDDDVLVNLPWPIPAALSPDGEIVDDASGYASSPLPGGRWPEPCSRIAILPIGMSDQAAPDAFLVAGLSPRRLADKPYRAFLRLVTAGIESALSSLKALESERRRREALTELDRSKTAFFSNVSHEFRTPLTLLLGPLREEIANEAIAPQTRERLEVCHRNGMRLLKLVNALLDFSRIEAGRMRARFIATDLASCTADLASHFDSACSSAGLELRVACFPLSEPAYIDRDMWEMIVFNLLSNAFKFTFEGQIEVKLTQAGRDAVLSVRDSGVGIAPGAIDRIFERFHRVEGARARTHEGSGIGLAMVQELVQMHGGRIEVESIADRGSVFTVTLPLGTAHLPPEQVTSEAAPDERPGYAPQFIQEALEWLRTPRTAPDALPVASLRNRILVAEDNADMREYLRRVLSEHWDVLLVPDGEAAVHALFTAPFDLLVTDVMMPRLDGFGLLKAVRSDPALRDLPVIMLSARAGEEARSEGRAAGADDYLVKPFSAQELVVHVRANLALAAVRRTGARERETKFASEREAHLELRRHWEDLARFLEQAPNAMMVLRGNDYTVEVANPAACRLWKKSGEQLVHKPFFEVLPEARAEGLDAIFEDVLATGQARRARLAPSVELTYSPLRSTDGRIDGIAITAFEHEPRG